MENEDLFKGLGGIVAAFLVFVVILAPAWLLLFLCNKGVLSLTATAISIPLVYAAFGVYMLSRER